MKIIYPNRISNLIADTADTNFPIANLLNDVVKKKWKAVAGVSDAVITGTVPKSAGVALFGTNATSITVALSSILELYWNTSAAGIEMSWNTSAAGIEISWGVSPITVPDQTFGLDENGVGSFWADWSEITTPHTITLTLNNNAFNTLDAGVLVAGDVTALENPVYGITEEMIDYSIIKEMTNGAIYYRKRDVVRSFSFDVWATREPDFWDFLLYIVKNVGPMPLAWNLMDNNSQFEWVVYAMLSSPPTGNHNHITQSVLSINLKEVV